MRCGVRSKVDQLGQNGQLILSEIGRPQIEKLGRLPERTITPIINGCLMSMVSDYLICIEDVLRLPPEEKQIFRKCFEQLKATSVPQKQLILNSTSGYRES